MKSPSERMGIFSVGDLRFFRGLKKCPPGHFAPSGRIAPEGAYTLFFKGLSVNRVDPIDTMMS